MKVINPSPRIWKKGKTKRVSATPCSGASIFSDHAWNTLSRSLWLSRRELQIVRGVFDDLTEFAIAADLNISTHTVHTHFERLHRKLAVVDRVSLVVRVVEEFLKLTILPGSLMPPLCATRTEGRCPLHRIAKGETQPTLSLSTKGSAEVDHYPASCGLRRSTAQAKRRCKRVATKKSGAGGGNFDDSLVAE